MIINKSLISEISTNNSGLFYFNEFNKIFMSEIKIENINFNKNSKLIHFNQTLNNFES